MSASSKSNSAETLSGPKGTGGQGAFSSLRRLLPLLIGGTLLIGGALWFRTSPFIREKILPGKDLPELEALVKSNPNDALAQYYLAKGYYRVRRFAEAQQAYETVTRLDPKSARAHLGLALSLAEQGKLREAKSEFETTLRYDPNSSWAEYMLGKLLWREGRTSDAVPHVKRAAELAPNSEQAWYGLGVCYIQLHRWSQAVEAMEKALTLKNDARYHTALGEVLLYQGKTEEGRKHYEEALRLDPNFGPACALMGGFYLRRATDPDALARAEELLLRATKLKTHQPQDLYFDLGQLYILKADFRKAAAALKESIRLDPRDERPYYALTKAYRQLGDQRAAQATEAQFRRISKLHIEMTSLESRVAMNPKNSDTQLALARVYRGLGLKDKAAERYMVCLRLRSGDAQVVRECEEFLKEHIPQPPQEFTYPTIR